MNKMMKNCMKKEKISIVVPCYNEEEVLPLFYKTILRVLDFMKSIEGQVIFVDDGSSDGTLSLLRKFGSQDKRCVYFSLSRNFGKEAALYAGLTYAKGDYVAVMDADLQDPPEMLPRMLHILKTEEYECVATCREDRKGEPVIRSFFAKKFYQIMNHISNTDMKNGARDFRLMKRVMVDAILSMKEYNRFSKGIFGWIGFRTKWLPFENVNRAAGKTKWSFLKLLSYSFDGMIGFSTKPLTYVSLLGLIICLISGLLIVMIVLRTLIWGDPVAGWPSLVCIVAFLSGVQLLCMGILGQYMAKTYMEVKNRPVYVLKESNEKDEDILKNDGVRAILQ